MLTIRLHATGTTFQSSPTLTGGCNHALVLCNPQQGKVSILTHPYGRMQPSPGRCSDIGRGSFNPHPPLRADATTRISVVHDPQ